MRLRSYGRAGAGARRERPTPSSRLLLFDGDESPCESGDKSPHSKTGARTFGQAHGSSSQARGRRERRSQGRFQISFARLANGDLGLTHTSLANGRNAFKVFRRSADDGETWSEPLKISDASHEYTTGPRDKLYVLASGRVLALLHCNLKPDAKKQGGPLDVYTVHSDDHGKSWSRTPSSDVLRVPDNPLQKHEWGFWEPVLVEHAPGKLLMLARTTTGWLWKSRSEDNGSTWSPPVQSTVPNPVAPPVLTRVPGTDTLVLIHNPDVKLSDSWHGGERVALAFRTSQDSGGTSSAPADIYRAPNNQLWVDYPAVRWINGQLHLVWRRIDKTSPARRLGKSGALQRLASRDRRRAAGRRQTHRECGPAPCHHYRRPPARRRPPQPGWHGQNGRCLGCSPPDFSLSLSADLT